MLAAGQSAWYFSYNPTFWVGAYVLARFLAAGFNEMRNVFFARGIAMLRTGISEFTMDHIQRQSLRFHLHRKTGKILRTVQRGSLSFSNVIQTMLFNIAPIFVEIGFTVGVLLTTFSYYFAVIILTTVFLYILATFLIQEWRNTLFKKMNIKDNNFNQKATDSLLNFETVKYFNAERHENRRFVAALMPISTTTSRLASSTSPSLLLIMEVSCSLFY